MPENALPPATGERGASGMAAKASNRDMLIAKRSSVMENGGMGCGRPLQHEIRRFRVVEPEEGFVASGHGQSGATERFDAYR